MSEKRALETSPSYYDILGYHTFMLGVSPNASSKAIDDAYKKVVLTDSLNQEMKGTSCIY